MDEAAVIGIIGLVAGIFGGLAGIGGSIIILPALHIVFGPLMYGEPQGRPEIYHVYMAAAMAVNFVVSLPAAMAHHKMGAVRTPLLRTLLPANALAVIAGVLLSNLMRGEALKLVLAFFLIAYCVWNLRLIIRPRRRKFTGEGRIERSTTGRLVLCGALPGGIGGVLGLGGGFMIVPMLQLVCNMKLKNAIATSSAMLSVGAAIGSTLKIVTLPGHGEPMTSALLYAVLMAPTAVIGSLAGARWLHLIHVTVVRMLITVLILFAAMRLLG